MKVFYQRPAALLALSFFFSSGPLCAVLMAQPENEPVQIDGDRIEFLMRENKVVADGHVTARKGDVTLFCDSIEYSNSTQMALARGQVTLLKGDERLTGDKMEFNFATMQGVFVDTMITAPPFYGHAKEVGKVGDNHLVLERGYLTTCDLDRPHFRLLSKHIDVYPGDKVVARKVVFKVGNVPIMYFPRYTQQLTDKKPAIIFTPGYEKDWGPFLLSRWRYKLNDYVSGTVHADYRIKKDLGWGIDTDYRTKGYGGGLVRTYYMNERTISSDFLFEERYEPTVERERFRAEWRHKWNIDDETNAIMQYYKLSDSEFLKDYFEREYDQDNSPDTYFLLTRGLPNATLSLRADKRVNRFESGVDRLPEISYALYNQPVADSGFYFQEVATYSNLAYKPASPTEDRNETMRVDADHELSYPLKLGIFDMTPFAGGEHTYYSRTNDQENYGSIRGIFRTGAGVSTKFYKIYEVETDRWGLDIHRLRHVVTPSVGYLYQHEPTLTNSELYPYDSIDQRDRAHSINFSLENKLQTKREDQSVDLTRFVLGAPFLLKEDPGKGGFNAVTSDLEVRPYKWLSFYFDSEYDTIAERLSTANFDIYVNGEDDRWFAGVSKRYNVDVDDQLTSEWGCRINPLWQYRQYQRFDLDSGVMKEQQYTLRRDLHAWNMDITFNTKQSEGNEIWIVMTMKAFPEIALNLGTTFNRRKAGTQ